ncbi:MAG: hypothetical protein WAO52_15110 [Prolixibacteraceae bacterium]
MTQETEKYTENFSSGFQSLLKKVSECGHLEQLIEILVHHAEELGEECTVLGNQAFDQISIQEKNDNPIPDNQILPDYIIDYQAAESLKYFILLWRDCIFQLQKARLFGLDSTGNGNMQQQLFQDSQDVLFKAGQDLLRSLNDNLEKAQKNPKFYKKQLRIWLLQKNPWPEYQNQIKAVVSQCRILHEKHLIIYKTAESFQRIKSKILDAVKFCQDELLEIENYIGQADNFIRKEVESPTDKSLAHIAHKIQLIESQVTLTYHIDIFNTQLEQELTKVAGETEFTIQIQQGLLMMDKINFHKRISLWLNREILPLLFEVWEITELSKNGLKMALQNIRNMALLNNSEAPDKKSATFNLRAYTQPLQVLIENNKEAVSQLDEFSNLLSHRIDIDLKLSLVYDTERFFLPFSSGTAITNRLNLGKSKLLKVSQSWLRSQITKIHLYRKKVVHEFTFSRSEKMVRFIQLRQRDDANNHYSSFFTTKGYFGDLFAIGRDEEMNHLSLLIKNWKDGYHGSAIITGQRFSGKTLTGELVASRNFADNTIRLSPGITISLGGRKMEASYNILDSLNFIAKNNQDKKYLVWIDDIELWWEPGIPFYKNVKDLTSFIDLHTSHFFFLVSMNLSTYHQIKQVMEVDRIFQAHIHLGKLSSREIEKAILIRHLATHRTLLNKKHEKIGTVEFKRITREIAQNCNGNIGDALNLWSYFTSFIDDDTVLFSPIPKFNFPEFYRPDLAVLLTSIMLQKRTNEYRLRKLFGPSFSDRYHPILLRMISIRVIERHLDGWLEINERVVNELGMMLDARHYLNY